MGTHQEIFTISGEVTNIEDLQLFLSQDDGLQEVYIEMENPNRFGPSLPVMGLASLHQKLAFILYITEFGSQLNKLHLETNSFLQHKTNFHPKTTKKYFRCQIASWAKQLYQLSLSKAQTQQQELALSTYQQDYHVCLSCIPSAYLVRQHREHTSAQASRRRASLRSVRNQPLSCT